MILNRLKELREAKGLSQERLASMVGVSRQTIVAMEKGGYNPSLELSFKIANALKVSLETVFEWKEDVV